MCRHYALLGNKIRYQSNPLEIWSNSTFRKGRKIDKLLKGGYSTISLGYIGLYEVTKLMKDVSHIHLKEGEELP